MFTPLQQVYIDSLKRQLEEANKVINYVDDALSRITGVAEHNRNYYVKAQRQELEEYKKKYNIKDD